MRYFNFEVHLLRSSVMLQATNEQIGVWLRLIAYCCDQENKGLIVGCNLWTDREWLIAIGIGKEDVLKPSPLWEYRDGVTAVLVVHLYPGKREIEERKKRAAGSKGGKSTSEAKRATARENGQKGGRPPKPKHNPTERKGKEYKIVPFGHDDLEPAPDPWPQSGQ